VRRGPARSSVVALAAAALAAGCDAQVESDYPGEPLATFRGRVTGDATLPPLEAAMLWQRGPPPSVGDQELATRAPVESGFPNSFVIRLYQPPPAAARRSLLPGEVSFARGNVGAVPQGVAADMVAALPSAGENAYGLDVAHWVIHLQQDVPPSSVTAWWLGAPLPAGYHLVRVTVIDPACIDLEACVGDLLVLGLDDATARGLCLAPYRLSPAPPDEPIVLELETWALPSAPPAPCP
jgi:hypothetical protein